MDFTPLYLFGRELHRPYGGALVCREDVPRLEAPTCPGTTLVKHLRFEVSTSQKYTSDYDTTFPPINLIRLGIRIY